MPRTEHVVSADDTDKLIELVKQHPLLYDPTSAEHKDAQKMFNTWASIAAIMDREKMTGSDWKKKWRGLRDTYVRKRREVKKSKSGQAAVRAKKWKYMDILSFLEEHVEENSTESNVPPVRIRHEYDSETSGEKSDDDCDAESVSTANSVPTANSVIPPTPRRSKESPSPANGISARGKRRKHDKGDMETALTNFMNETTRARQETGRQLKENSPKTCDDAFFESCAMRMQKLPDTTRSFLQLQISQLFFNAENPQLPNVPITPLLAQVPTQQQAVPTYRSAIPKYQPLMSSMREDQAIPKYQPLMSSMREDQFDQTEPAEQVIVCNTANIISTAMEVANSM